MRWPLSQDYNEAIQSPRGNFNDPDLQQGKVVTNPLGIPLPRSGNFADVYELRCPDGRRWAVKCFTREVPGLRERYAAISRHLTRAQLPFNVNFTFLEQGIRVGGRWFPVLKMQWVDGLTLNAFVRQYADKPPMLNSLLQIWVRMAARLRQACIAHADLQHGNILLVAGLAANALALKLVDYDGMFVPALAGSNSGEVGHPCYQHPQRFTERTYSQEVDRFPLLLIATALTCLRIGGRQLWDKFDNGDNLLFSEPDLRAPVKSPLFYELLKIADPQASRLVRVMLVALKVRLESVPLLEEVLPELYPQAARKPTTPKPITVVKSVVTQPGAELQPVAKESWWKDKLNLEGSQPVTEAQSAPQEIWWGDTDSPETSQEVAEAQAAEELVATGSASSWDFEAEEKPHSRRRRVGQWPVWLWAVSGAGLVALVLVGCIFSLLPRSGKEKSKPKPDFARSLDLPNHRPEGPKGGPKPDKPNRHGNHDGGDAPPLRNDEEEPKPPQEDSPDKEQAKQKVPDRAGKPDDPVAPPPIEEKHVEPESRDTIDEKLKAEMPEPKDRNPNRKPKERLEGPTYLSELSYLEPIRHLNDQGTGGGFSTDGTIGGKKFVVEGKESPHGIFIHPAQSDFSEISYNLERKWLSFLCGVAVPRMGEPEEERGLCLRKSALRFEVIGDDRVLWTSKPVSDFNKPQSCEINVEKVSVLRLRVHCPGLEWCARAVWIEPRVTTSKEVPPHSIEVLTPAGAADKERQKVTVQFRVQSSGGNAAEGGVTELYSEQQWHHAGCFFIRIPDSKRSTYQELGIPDIHGFFRGQLIRVVGTVTTLRFEQGSFPCIYINDPSQILIPELPPTRTESHPKTEIKEQPTKTAESTSSSTRVNRQPDRKETAEEAYEKSCFAARTELLKAFDRVVDNLTKGSEKRRKLIDQVNEERFRFENSKKLIPWSEPMRRDVKRYLNSLAAARGRLISIYESEIRKLPGAKNQSKVAELQQELRIRLGVHVMAKWQRSRNGIGINAVTLYSNWTIDNPDGNATWRYENGVLYFTWPDPNAPAGAWRNNLQVSDDGKTFEGTNYDIKPENNRPLLKGAYVP